ncbi:MAG: hypothetical protein LBG92_03030, partial [Prevotellaceae bacterium]|nr:hypothetical protein [Prevotellaceae bacterium]
KNNTNAPYIVSKELSFDGEIIMERDVYLHNANDYLNSNTAFNFNNKKQIVFFYFYTKFEETYTEGIHQIQPIKDINLYRNIALNFRADKDDHVSIYRLNLPLNTILGKWFHEKVIISKSGTVSYFVDNKLIGSYDLSKYLNLSKASTFTVAFASSGRDTGHKHYFDNFSISGNGLSGDVGTASSASSSRQEKDIYQSVKTLDCYTKIEPEMFVFPDNNLAFVKISENTFSLIDLKTLQEKAKYNHKDKDVIKLKHSYFENNILYLAVSDKKGEIGKYAAYNLQNFSAAMLKCKNTPRGCIASTPSSNYSALRNGTPYNFGEYKVFFWNVDSKYYYEIVKVIEENRDFNTAVKGSRENKLEFLTKYPNSEYKKDILNSFAFATTADIYDFIKSNGEHRDLLEEKAFSLTKQANTVQSFQQYLAAFPSGKYANDARKTIAAIQKKADDEAAAALAAEKAKQEAQGEIIIFEKTDKEGEKDIVTIDLKAKKINISMSSGLVSVSYAIENINGTEIDRVKVYVLQIKYIGSDLEDAEFIKIFNKRNTCLILESGAIALVENMDVDKRFQVMSASESNKQKFKMLLKYNELQPLSKTDEAEQKQQKEQARIAKLKNLKKGDKIEGNYYHSSAYLYHHETIEGEAVQWNSDRTSLLIKVTKVNTNIDDARTLEDNDYDYAKYKGNNIKVSESIWITDLYNDDYKKDYLWSKK